MKVGLFFLCCFALNIYVFALYEDQIGKFDWKKEFIGEVFKIKIFVFLNEIKVCILN